MNPRFLALRAALVLVLAGALASCSDTTGPAGANDVPAPTLSVVDAPGDFIVAVSNGGFDNIAAAVADLGGAVVRAHPQVGLLIASGLSDAAAASLGAMDGVQAMAADFLIPVPGPEGLQAEAMGVAVHDPSQAFFFQGGFQWDMQIIDADVAWAAGASANGATVAILDTGIDPYHQDLAGLVDWSRSVAFVPNANPLIPAWGDDHYHGTHVAGTVSSNGLGTAGVAPHATLMAVKVCGAYFGCPYSAILSGIIHAADNGANVVNMSLGGFVYKPGSQLNAILNRVMNYAARHDVLVVSASGNSGLDLDHLGRDFGAGMFTATPCESGNGMCIGATNVLDQVTSYSNRGRSAVNMVAPGGDGLFPVLAPCSSVSVIIPICATSPTWYVWLTGTSMATPHVAGAGAVLAGKGITNPGQMKTILEQSADDLGKAGADAYYSKGRLNVMGAFTRR